MYNMLPMELYQYILRSMGEQKSKNTEEKELQKQSKCVVIISIIH